VTCLATAPGGLWSKVLWSTSVVVAKRLASRRAEGAAERHRALGGIKLYGLADSVHQRCGC
jgi:hypothetical protein